MTARLTPVWHSTHTEQKDTKDAGGVLRVEDVRRVAAGLLAHREHSTVELQRKLTQRRFPDSLIDEALIGLKADNLLSDERFASEYVRSFAGRGQGPLKIRSGLLRRGIEPQRADRLLYSGERDWQALANDARTRRFGNTIPVDFKERARQARFLQQRGFDHDQARRAARL